MSEKRIGNTTNSKRDTDKITKYNSMYSEEIREYKKFAIARRNKRKHKQESLVEFVDKLEEYLEEKRKTGKPLTIAGIMLTLGIDRNTWYKALDGELDYLLEEYIAINHITDSDVTYIDNLPYHFGESGRVMLIPYSEFLQKVYLLIQERLEENLYSNRGNPAGSIFSLKHNYHWREDDNPQHIVEHLVVADSEQAKKAMEMLLTVGK